jgi:hypothetical protein
MASLLAFMTIANPLQCNIPSSGKHRRRKADGLLSQNKEPRETLDGSRLQSAARFGFKIQLRRIDDDHSLLILSTLCE